MTDMIKHLVVCVVLVAYSRIACANVKVMSNTELDEVVLATQPQQIQPVLPEYDSNGQIGGVTGALSASSAPVTNGLGAPVATPAASTGVNGGVTLQLPVSPLTDMMLNSTRNLYIPQNIGR